MSAQAVEPPASTPPASAKPAAAQPSPTTEVTYSGMKVGIDAKTGKLRPLSAEESQQLDQMLIQGRQPTFAPGMAKTFNAPDDEAAARATSHRRAHGGVSVKLPQDQMSTVSLHRDANGQLRVEHSDEAGNTAQAEELK